MQIERQQIEPAELAKIVRQAYGDAVIMLGSWQIAPLVYENISPDSRGLYRVSVTAHSHDRSLDWSVVLKCLARLKLQPWTIRRSFSTGGARRWLINRGY